MFERFSEAARRALFFGRYEATNLGHLAIEPEHLALGVLRQASPGTWSKWGGQSDAASAVMESLRALRVRSLEAGDVAREIPFSPAAKQTLQASAAIADRLRHSAITPNLLLAAIIVDTPTPASRLLREAGLTAAALEAPANGEPAEGAPSNEFGVTLHHALGRSIVEMVDERELQRLCDTLFVATDQKEWDTARSVFADGAIAVDMTSLAGGAPATMTADELIAGFRASLHDGKISHHLVTSYAFALTDPTAKIRANGYAWNRVAALAPDDLWETWGTYRFTAQRTNSGWKLDGFTYSSKLTRGNDAVLRA